MWLFIRGSERKPRAFISALVKSGVLLVGEDGDFLNQGGMINLTLIDGQTNFEVNSASLEHAGIRFGPNSSTAVKGDTAPSTPQSGKLAVAEGGQRSPPYPEIARRMDLKVAVSIAGSGAA
jgi:YfiR/HmsC-like